MPGNQRLYKMLLSQFRESSFRMGCMTKDDGVGMFCVSMNVINAAFWDFESFL